MVSRDPDAPMYRQVAGILRERIRGGRLVAGQRLGSESDLAHEFEVSVATIGTALAELRAEGYLAPAVSGQAARVRELADVEVVTVSRGSRIRSRPATHDEHRQLGLSPGAWVLTVEHGGQVQVYRADVTVLRCP